MPGMNVQPAIDFLNAKIKELTSARDTLIAAQGGVPKEKPISSNRSLAQRRRWAEQKRRQRDAKKGKK